MGLRSNRPLTQFACDQINHLLRGDSSLPFETQKGNTKVAFITSQLLKILKVYLCDQEIVSLLIAAPGVLQQDSSVDLRVCSIRISIGDNLTFDGFPRKTTVERINGILDELSSHDAIPVGVRMYKHREQDTYALGKGDDYVAVGRNTANRVIITPDSKQLIIGAA
jgi:hypothetical protein